MARSLRSSGLGGIKHRDKPLTIRQQWDQAWIDQWLVACRYGISYRTFHEAMSTVKLYDLGGLETATEDLINSLHIKRAV